MYEIDIIDLARNFAKQIQKTEEYKNLDIAKKNNDADFELVKLMEKFNMLKFEVRGMESNNKFQEETLNEKNDEINRLYEKIMANENMICFNKASDNMNRLMDKINKIFIAAVNGENPMEVSISENLGCSGSCSHCSGCR